MKSIILNIKPLLFLTLGLIIMHSCKTEYEQIKKPYNQIQRFAIAGYGDLDSVSAVISGNEIIVYWNADAEIPETIKPSISISPAAIISPASGEEVPFSENTTYTVTAEDGTVNSYKLKPVLNKTIPKLFSMPIVHEWRDNNPISIVGEYFLAAGDFSAIKVYGQRIRDGFEFDIPINEESSTSTKLVVNLPELTSDLDTGAHRIYVKVGEFASNYLETWIYQPSPNYVFKDSTKIDKYGDILLGEEIRFELRIKEGMEDIAARYYGKESLKNLYIYGFLPPGGAGYTAMTIPQEKLNSIVTITDNFKFTVKLDPEVFTQYTNYRIIGVTPSYHRQLQAQVNDISKSFMWNDPAGFYADIKAPDFVYDPTIDLLQNGQQVSLGQELTINYTFSTEALHTQYSGRLQYVYFVFKDPTTGFSEVVRFQSSQFTNTAAESKIKITLPTTNTALKGKTIETIGLSFYDIRTRTYKQPRVKLTNTTIANN